MTRSKESNRNLIFNEVRNLSKRINDFSVVIEQLQEATQDNSIDIEQLGGAVEQLRNRLEYLEQLLKAAVQKR